MKPATEATVEVVSDEHFDDLEATANRAMNSARAARVRADKVAHETYLEAKQVARRNLSAAEKVFDAEIARIDKLRKEAAKAK